MQRNNPVATVHPVVCQMLRRLVGFQTPRNSQLVAMDVLRQVRGHCGELVVFHRRIAWVERGFELLFE